MKFLSALLLTLTTSISLAQSEKLVPKDAVSVFSINNINLLQKIPLDELIQYEFMEEVQQEIFDGSTSGKTLKDTGIDYDQKMNIFFGRSSKFEVSGFTFGISNKDQLFQVFDDFEKDKSNYPDVEFYSSYFNHLAIQNNVGILFRVSPSMEIVNSITDSIWYARGNDYPWYDDAFFELEESFEQMDTLNLEEVEFFDEMEIEENTSTPIEQDFPIADDDPNAKNYYELRDSVDMSLQIEFLRKVCDELFKENETLLNSSKEFKNQMTSNAEGTFFFDNARNMSHDYNLWELKAIYPSFYASIDKLYKGNVILGELNINENDIVLDMDTHYGEDLGSIYEKMGQSKFDKNILKYIHKDNSAFFTYNLNMREAYEQSYDVIVPILEKENAPLFSAILLSLELYDEFLNKDALFDTYKGSVFGTYNGIQKVKTKKFIFEYDEETFEYTEEEVEAEEDMPLFTFGISTDRGDIAEKILKYLSKASELCHKEENYWVYENAILNAAPLYMLLQNDLFILTNDIHLAKEHPEGYGSDAIGKTIGKRVKKNGMIYGYADLGKAIENLPREMFNDEENEMIDVLRGKSGTIEITSSKSTSEKTTMQLTYNFEGEYEASSTYILDLINSLYVITK